VQPALGLHHVGVARALDWNIRALNQRLESILFKGPPASRASWRRACWRCLDLFSLLGVGAPSLHTFRRWLPEIPDEPLDAQCQAALDLAEERLLVNTEAGALNEIRGRALVGLWRYDEASEAFHAQFDCGHRKSTASYNLACALAKGGLVSQAIDALVTSLALGTPSLYVEQDRGLDGLRGEPGFQKLLFPDAPWRRRLLASEAGEVAELVDASDLKSEGR
jgi:hypothetical protein